MSSTPSSEPNDQNMDSESVDDAFRSLMEGLRTTLPGVQVLFAFLLILPFRPEFSDLSLMQRRVFYLAFAMSAVGSVLLIAPSVHQRVRAPVSGVQRRTARHVMVASHMAVAGTICLAVAITAVSFLVSQLVFGVGIAAVALATVGLLIAWAWFYVPIVDFARDGSG
jgi:hypothetical protein